MATKLSAGVCVGIGGHLEKNHKEVGDEQFEISDNRSFEEIYTTIKKLGLQPVTSEYIYV